METFDVIKGRRSIRKFKPELIEHEKIDKILLAGMYAPTARNTQSWRFIVVTEREILDKIPKLHPYAEMVYTSPLAILICGDTEAEKSLEYNLENCSAAAQNMLLAAYDLGIGSVWLGVYPRKERVENLANLFNVPANIIPMVLIAFGYPDEIKKTEERFDKNKIHYNKW